MNNTERQRLNYKPKIGQINHIYTKYDGNIIKDNIDSNAVISGVLKSFERYNIAIPLRDGHDIIKMIDKELTKIKNKLLQSDLYNGLPDAIANKDYIAIDNYTKMFDNINGSIQEEIYPVLVNLRDDLNRLIDTINQLGFDNEIDFDDIDTFITEQANLRQTIIKLELQGKIDKINYKAISLDTQISKFVEDRITLLGSMIKDLLNITTAKSKILMLPQDEEMIQDFYDTVLETYTDDREKMNCYDSTDVVYTLLNKVYTLKRKVLRNRNILSSANKETFFNMLSVAKGLEDKLDKTMVDLYKSQVSDEINKGDYYSTLLSKHKVRESYKSQIINL